MLNLLQRPEGGGTSRTKLTALAAMLWPFVEPYLAGEEALPVDGSMLAEAGPFIIVGLLAFFLRAAIRGNGPDLMELLDRYEGAFRERQELREKVRDLQQALTNQKPATPSRSE